MTDLASLAAPLLRATARARSLKESTLVIKLGGSAMEDPAATAGTLNAIAAMQTLSLRIILVHGGGKPIDRAMTAAGIEPKKIAGRRYTSKESLRIVIRVLRQITEQLTSELLARNVVALRQHPIESDQLKLTDSAGAKIDLGWVGVPVNVIKKDLISTLESQYVAVIPSFGRDINASKRTLYSGWLNINADTAASAVAGAMKAEACYFLTDTPGVLANCSDPSSLYARLTVAQCRDLIATGIIDGGMIPKVEACFEALEAGAKRAVILDGRNPHSLLSEFVSDTVLGTEIVP